MKKNEIFDFIVVGAGISGLTAAMILTEQGLNGIVLEQQRRTGGRILPVKTSDGLIVEGGASWYHDSKKNPLFQACNHKHLLHSTLYALEKPLNKLDSMVVFDEDGKIVPPEKIQQVKQQLTAFSQYMNQHLDEFRGKISQDQAIDKFCQERTIKGKKERLLKAMLEIIVSSDQGERLKNISGGENLAEVKGDNDQGNSHDYISAPGKFISSYSKLIYKLSQNSNILLAKKVTKINYEDDQAVINVETDEKKMHHFCSRRVLVTVPIGVLKQQIIKFSPVLPLETQNAIIHMNAGNFRKYVLVFKKIFWDPYKEVIVFLNQGRIYEFSSFKTQEEKINKIPILILFARGKVSKHLRQFNEKEAIDEILKVMSKSEYDTKPATFLKEYCIIPWDEHPASYGSYSSPGLKTMPEDYKKIAGPHQGNGKATLHIAGEATSLEEGEYNDYGTTHGAFKSGINSAKLMIFMDMSNFAQYIMKIKIPFPTFFNGLVIKFNEMINGIKECNSYFGPEYVQWRSSMFCQRSNINIKSKLPPSAVCTPMMTKSFF